MAVRRCGVMWQPFGGQSAGRRTMTCEPGLGVPSPRSDTSTRLSGVHPASHHVPRSLSCQSRPIACEPSPAENSFETTHAERTCAAVVPANRSRECCHVNPDLGPGFWCPAVDPIASVPLLDTGSIAAQRFRCILYAMGDGVGHPFKE